MSDATDVVAPETDPAVPEPVLDAPGDGTAVDTEGAELRSRFNGLMAAHQRALDALGSEREQRLAAEARLTEGQITVSEDNATLSEVQALRAELAESRLAVARAEALRQYPDAAPFADLIVGNSPTEVMQVTRAFAERAVTLKTPPVDQTVTPTPEPPVQPGSLAPLVPGNIGAPAPMAAGGFAPPGVPTSQSDLLQEAKRIAMQRPGTQDAWDAFLASTVTPQASAGLA